MAEKLTQIIARGEDTFVVPIESGGQMSVDKKHCAFVGLPVISSDILRTLTEAPSGANAYAVGKPHVRTDLHGNFLQAVQFYSLPEFYVR